MSRSTLSYQSCRDASGPRKGCLSRGCAGVRAAEWEGVCEKFGVGGVNAWGWWVRAAVGWQPQGKQPRGLSLPSGLSGGVPGAGGDGRWAGGRDGAGVAAPGHAGAGALA